VSAKRKGNVAVEFSVLEQQRTAHKFHLQGWVVVVDIDNRDRAGPVHLNAKVFGCISHPSFISVSKSRIPDGAISSSFFFHFWPIIFSESFDIQLGLNSFDQF